MPKIIFFAKSNNEETCLCFKKFQLLKPFVFSLSIIKYKLIDDSIPLFETYTKSNNAVIFGIKNIEFPVIETPKNRIGPQWFGGKKRIAVFFIPKGVKLFETDQWKEQFDEYVTFKNVYEFLIEEELPVIVNNCKKLNRKIIKISCTENDAEMIYKKLKTTYEAFMANLLLEVIKGKHQNHEDDVYEYINKIRHNYYNLEKSTT